MAMPGVRHSLARAIALFAAAVMVWPMAAAAFAAPVPAADRCVCCRRMTRTCHCCSHSSIAPAVQAICYCRGKTHAIAAGRAHLPQPAAELLASTAQEPILADSLANPLYTIPQHHEPRAPPAGTRPL